MADRRGGQARVRLPFLAAMATASALTYLGCSSKDDSEVASDASVDAIGDASTDTRTTVDSSDAYVCPDKPFDCSGTAGDAGSDGDAGFAGEVPLDLRCTGLYACWSDKTPKSDHREYKPAFTLWSDGAEKTRWLHLPANTTIDTGGSDAGTPDDWVFPVGTMVYKEFQLGGKRVETRRVWKASANEWVYSVWRWSTDESAATLMNSGEFVPNAALPGHVYEVPSAKACPACHDGHGDKFLSLDAWGLGAGAEGVTLAALKSEGRLSGWTFGTSFNVPQDGTGKLDKAIGWYYNNCGFCHKPGRPGGGTGLMLNLPVAAALPHGLQDGGGGLPDGGIGIPFAVTPLYATAVGIPHNDFHDLFPPDHFKRITPGSSAASVLPVRDGLRDPDGGIATAQMPPLLEHAVDDAGVGATRAWIDALHP